MTDTEATAGGTLVEPVDLAQLEHIVKTAGHERARAIRVGPELYEVLRGFADDRSRPLYLDGGIGAPLGTPVVVDYGMPGLEWSLDR